MAHVLLVDDDPALRYLLHAVVQDDGHTTLEAADGVEALATLGDSRGPLIVLLDWQMPRLGGFGVLRAVAADPRQRAWHRFVLVTAADWQQDPEHAALLEQLQVPVVPKSFNLATISEVVEEEVARLAQNILAHRNTGTQVACARRACTAGAEPAPSGVGHLPWVAGPCRQ